MNFVFLITGLLFIFIVGWLVSSDRKNIKYKRMGILFALQIVISFLCLHTSGGIKTLSAISGFFNWLMKQAAGELILYLAVLHLNLVEVYFS